MGLGEELVGLLHGKAAERVARGRGRNLRLGSPKDVMLSKFLAAVKSAT